MTSATSRMAARAACAAASRSSSVLSFPTSPTRISRPWRARSKTSASTAGYMAVVYSTGQDSDRESQVLKMMRVQRVAGLIVIPTRSDAEHGSRLVGEIHVPTVLLDMFVEGLPYDVIKTDNVEAGRLATDHLLEAGPSTHRHHRRHHRAGDQRRPSRRVSQGACGARRRRSIRTLKLAGNFESGDGT